MKFGPLLLFGGAALAAAAYVRTHHHPAPEAANETASSEAPAMSANGFVALPMTGSVPANTVVLCAPLNCPHEEAQRADQLARTLGEEGIPVSRTNQIAFSCPPDQMDKYKEATDKVMLGRGPIALINGRAKNNPSVADIESEYRASRSP